MGDLEYFRIPLSRTKKRCREYKHKKNVLVKTQEEQTLNIDHTGPVYIIYMYILCVLWCCEFKYADSKGWFPLVFKCFEKTVKLMLTVVTSKGNTACGRGPERVEQGAWKGELISLLDSKLFNIQAAAVFVSLCLWILPCASLSGAISASSTWNPRVCQASGRCSGRFSAPQWFPSCRPPREEEKKTAWCQS